MWQFLIVLYFVFGSASYLLRRQLAQKIGEHNRLINAIFYLIFLLPVGAVLTFLFPHNLHVGWLNLVFLLVGSAIWPLYYIIGFSANKKVDAGIFAIINNLSPIVTLGIALPFLHERVTVLQVIGIGLLILSGVLAASSKLEGDRRTRMNGIYLCILSAVFLGLGVAYERFLLNRVDFGAYFVYGWGSQIIWSLALAGKELKLLPTLLKKGSTMRTTLLGWGTSSALRSASFILALKTSGSASLVSAASDFLSVTVVIAAYFYLKERQNMLYKISAAAIGVAGLLLVAR